MIPSLIVVVFTFFLASCESFSLTPKNTGHLKGNIRTKSWLLSTSSNVENAFDSYSISDPLQQLAYRDTEVGTGEVIEKGKVVTVAYEGRLMSNGFKFDFGKGYAFRFGEGRVIPGWEVGLVVRNLACSNMIWITLSHRKLGCSLARTKQGMRVGGKRTLRIPPSLAYGDRGAKDKIPPGAHLEFDCELKSMASNPIEELVAQFNMQPERITTFILLVILLAASGSFP
jgi:FKBP-type peptidyl-prolyl cis-trans isomerase